MGLAAVPDLPPAGVVPELPTSRTEAWRFAPLVRLRPVLSGELALSPASLQVESTPPVALRAGALLDPVAPVDRATYVARQWLTGTDVVSVPPGVELESPIRVILDATGGAACRDVRLDVGAQASATIVVERVGAGTLLADLTVSIGDGARVTLLSLTDAAPGAVVLGAEHVTVGADATLDWMVVTLGGEVIRLRPEVSFAAPGGDATLSGVFLTGSSEHHEHRVHIEHLQPSCRSRVMFKGALDGAGAHSVWIGDVLIGPAARGTDSYEVNRNLVLTPGARADSVPNLEILTGDVAGAGHASATGRFDEEHLFYLMSRGITEDEARRLVVRGFFAELVERIPLADYRDRLVTTVDERLLAAGR